MKKEKENNWMIVPDIKTIEAYEEELKALKCATKNKRSILHGIKIATHIFNTAHAHNETHFISGGCHFLKIHPIVFECFDIDISWNIVVDIMQQLGLIDVKLTDKELIILELMDRFLWMSIDVGAELGFTHEENITIDGENWNLSNLFLTEAEAQQLFEAIHRSKYQ